MIKTAIQQTISRITMPRHFIVSIAAALLSAAVLPANLSASVIFTNFGPSQGYDLLNYNIVGNDFAGDNLAQGDTFTPGSTATFGDLQLALSCSASCPDPFTVALTLDSGADYPGTVVESFNVAGTSLGSVGVDNTPIMLTSVLHPTLSSGTQYWVTVSSDLNDTIAWSDNTTGDVSDQAVSSDGGTTWFSPSGATPSAYEVDSSTVVSGVPEPGTFVMLAGMLPLLWFVRRLKRRT